MWILGESIYCQFKSYKIHCLNMSSPIIGVTLQNWNAVGSDLTRPSAGFREPILLQSYQ